MRRLIRNEIRAIELPEYVHKSFKYTLSLNALDTRVLILKRKHRYVPCIYSDSVSLSRRIDSVNTATARRMLRVNA